MHRRILPAAALVLAAACSKDQGTLQPAATLQTPAVDAGGVLVVTLSAINPGTTPVRVTTPNSCVANARIVDSAGTVVGSPTILCSQKEVHYQFPAGETQEWDVGVDVRVPRGSYRVIATLTLGAAAQLQDTLPLTVR